MRETLFEGSWHLELIDVPQCSPLRVKWVFLAVFGRGGLQFEHIGVLAALRCLPSGPEVTGSGAVARGWVVAMRIAYSLVDRLIAYPCAHNLSVSAVPIRVRPQRAGARSCRARCG